MIWQGDHKPRRLDLAQSGGGGKALSRRTQCPLYLEPAVTFAQNMDAAAQIGPKSESLQQHCTQFVLEAFENKEFLSKLTSREVDIALSWGEGGKDHRKPCINRGRQEKWYKDSWPSRWQRLWRLWPYRAAKTVRRCRLHLMRLHKCPSITTGWFTKDCFFGRAFGPVRFARVISGGTHG